MRSAAWLRVRRALALASILALLGSVGEVLVPEAHDAGSHLTGEQAGTPAPDQPANAPNHAPDASHICHCPHAHVAVPSIEAGLTHPATAYSPVPGFLRQSPPLPPVTDLLRPPIT